MICFCQAGDEASREEGEEVKRGFLGVMVGEVKPEVRAQVPLESNQGLLVRMVAPGSPAERAGIKAHDILLKVKDRTLFSQTEFVSLIENSRPGSEVEVVWMHRGLERRAKVALGEAAGRKNAEPGEGESLALNAVEWVEKLNAIMRTLQENPEAVDAVDRMLHPQGEGDWRDGPLFNLNAGQNYRLICTDDEGSVEICEHDGAKYVKVFDRRDRLLFQGPFTTPEEKAEVPAAIRQRVEKVESTCGELARRRKARDLAAPSAPAQRETAPPAAAPEPASPP